MGRPFEFEPRLSSPQLQTPKLFLLGELNGERKHGIFDPINRKLTTLNLPQLASNLQCISSGHGWLLLLSRQNKPKQSSLFFFNPQTREKIDLPFRNAIFTAAAFTEPPTSPSCTLFVVTCRYDSIYRNFIDVLHVRKDEHWTRYFYEPSKDKIYADVFDAVSRVVLCYGKLFCVNVKGEVGIFDVNSATWKVIPMVDGFKNLPISYLAESNGRIFGGLKPKNGGVDKVFEFKLVNGRGSWIEVEDMDEMVMFLGECGSQVLSGLGGDLPEDRVFVGRDDPQFKCGARGARHVLGEFGWCYSSLWV